jgi:hypothetical protein
MNILKKSNGTFNVGCVIVICMLPQDSLLFRRCYVLIAFNEENSDIIGFW